MMTVEKYNEKRPESENFVKFYVAYGSNMDLDQMIYRCKSARFYAKGILKDYRLLFKQCYATIEPEEGAKVPICIFQITTEDEKNLDKYEGYPSLYYKQTVQVTTDTNETLQAMVYIMHEEFPYMLPSVVYYENMEMCYKTFNFDKAILESALIFSYLQTDKFPSASIEETKQSESRYMAIVDGIDCSLTQYFNSLKKGRAWVKNHSIKQGFVEGMILDEFNKSELVFYIDSGNTELCFC